MITATPIGFRATGNAQQLVGIPIGLRLKHTHVVGNAGTGKSTLIEHMVLHDIQAGYGVAVIDPHGSLVERLLSLIPRGHTDRVICLNPGERDWVPVWNPLRHRIPARPALLADALTRVLSPGDGLGDGAEYLLRQAILAVLQLPSGNLGDVLSLLRRRGRDKQGARLLARVLRTLDDEVAREFWEVDVHDLRVMSPTDGFSSTRFASETSRKT